MLVTKKWLYWLPNLVNMELSIDKRTVDILYVDKENLHNFTGTDIVKFITNNDINGIDLFVALLSGVYNLKPAETNLLKVVVNYNRKVLFILNILLILIKLYISNSTPTYSVFRKLPTMVYQNGKSSFWQCQG